MPKLVSNIPADLPIGHETQFTPYYIIDIK